jgi:hypothetical protein
VEPSHGSPLAVHVRGGMMRALKPARSGMRGLKTSRRREHARGVATPYHIQVTENVGEAAPACTSCLHPGVNSVRNFTKEGHSTVAETAQGLEGDGAENVARTIVVQEVFVQLFLVPAKRSATGFLGGAMHIAGSESVDEGDIP